jgi:WD40 repeat protein
VKYKTVVLFMAKKRKILTSAIYLLIKQLNWMSIKQLPVLLLLFAGFCLDTAFAQPAKNVNSEVVIPSQAASRQSLKEIKRLRVKSFINAVAWNKDGSRLAAISYYGSTITMWETKNWTIVHEFQRYSGSYSGNSLAFLTDGSLLTAAPLGDYSKDPRYANAPLPVNDPSYKSLDIFSLIQWNPETGMPVRYIPELGNPPKDLSVKKTDIFTVSKDGSLIAGIGNTAYVLLYETLGSSLVQKLSIPLLPKHKDGAMSIAFSPDGQELAVGTLFGMVHFFGVKDGALRRSFMAYPDDTYLKNSYGCRAIAYSTDGRLIATGKSFIQNPSKPDTTTTDVWRVSDNARVASLTGSFFIFGGVKNPSKVRTLSWSPKGDILAIGDEGSLRVWEINEQDQKRLFLLESRYIYSTSYSPQGILAVTNDNEVILLR